MSCGTIAGLVLGGAGAGVNAYAGERTHGAMNSAVNQEMARNRGYQQQGQQVFQQSLDQSTPQAAKQQIGQGQQQLAGLIQNAQAVPLSASMPSNTLGDSGVNAQAQQAKTNMSNTAASNYGGYSNYGLQQYLKDMQAQNQLGVINQNARGWANVLPAQLQDAQNSQQGLQALGSLLGTAGLVTGLGSAMSAPATGVSASQSANVLGEMNGTSYLGVPTFSFNQIPYPYGLF